MSPSPAVREATAADNDALVALSLACPMEGDIGLCVDRAPDFFALNRLEGDRWRVGVVDGADGAPVGCIAVAERTVHVNGAPRRAAYVSDLKVHPDHRGAGVADALSEWARDACVAYGGDEVLVFLAVLAGNRSMQRRMGGPRGLPHVERVATVRTFSIPLLWRRRPPRGPGVTVRAGHAGDVEDMARLWGAVAPGRQFSPVHDAVSLARWIDAAADLDLGSYRLAHREDGGLAGFLGVWDQSSFKQLRVTSYSRRLAVVRSAFNVVAPFLDASRLPPAGGALRNVSAVQVCVPPGEPQVLRALVADACETGRRAAHSFLNVGLDVADPLAAALSRLGAQTTDVWFCVATPSPGSRPPALDARPVHHEIALV